MERNSFAYEKTSEHCTMRIFQVRKKLKFKSGAISWQATQP